MNFIAGGTILSPQHNVGIWAETILKGQEDQTVESGFYDRGSFIPNPSFHFLQAHSFSLFKPSLSLRCSLFAL